MGLKMANEISPYEHHGPMDARRLARIFADEAGRLSTAVTCTGVQAPPRAVGTPRAFSALAMARKDVTPLVFISMITGSTLAAKRSAFALLEATP